MLLWSYMFIYNFALFALFTTFLQISNFNLKTLYSLSDLGATSTFTKVLMIALFSMAGVPPFWGFFSKIFIFLLLLNSNFGLFFGLFFILLFTGLYFYIQNIRFLNPTSGSHFIYDSELGIRQLPLYYYLTYPVLFILVFGCFFTEDLFLVLLWILN